MFGMHICLNGLHLHRMSIFFGWDAHMRMSKVICILAKEFGRWAWDVSPWWFKLVTLSRIFILPCSSSSLFMILTCDHNNLIDGFKPKDTNLFKFDFLGLYLAWVWIMLSVFGDFFTCWYQFSMDFLFSWTLQACPIRISSINWTFLKTSLLAWILVISTISSWAYTFQAFIVFSCL